VTSLHDGVRDVVAQTFLRSNTQYPLDNGTDFLQAGICDSLGLMELAVAIEQRFPSVRINDQDITPANFGSINRIVALLNAKGAV